MSTHSCEQINIVRSIFTIFKCTCFLIQVENADCPRVDFGIGERAMLIKDAYGDWGVVTGIWKDFKKGVKGTSRKAEIFNRVSDIPLSILQSIPSEF